MSLQRSVALSLFAATLGCSGGTSDLLLPATPVPQLPAITETERLGDAYAVVGMDARRQVVGLFREALVKLGAQPSSALAGRPPGRIRLGGLVVTRQHPMTARGTVESRDVLPAEFKFSQTRQERFGFLHRES